MKKSILTAFAIITSVSATYAVDITVGNYSFENPDDGIDIVSGTSAYVNNPSQEWLRSGNWGIQDWTDSDFAGTTGDVSSLPGTADANQAAYINAGSTIYQDVGSLMANTTYTLTVAIGDRLAKNYADTITLQFYNGSDTSGTLLGSMLSDDVAPNGSFADYSYSVTTGASVSGDLTIALYNPNASGHTVVDNVRLTAAAVPEPSTYAALAGMVMLGAAAYRRRKQS